MRTLSPIYIITGTPASGKTTVATALMRRFPYGLHIPVDDLREWVVSGIAQPVPEWTDESNRQFRLARQAAAQTALIYADAGFAVAIDDVIFPYDAQAFFIEPLSGRTVHKVLLQPRVEVAIERNANRTNKAFDTSTLSEVTRSMHRAMAERDYAGMGWLVIDNSEQSLEETVDEILRRTSYGEIRS